VETVAGCRNHQIFSPKFVTLYVDFKLIKPRENMHELLNIATSNLTHCFKAVKMANLTLKKDNGVTRGYCPALPADITELNFPGISNIHQMYYTGAIIPDYAMNWD
jgi:hypothetical protein